MVARHLGGGGAQVNDRSAPAPGRPDDRAVVASAMRDSGLDRVWMALKGIRFGAVRVIVQDGQIIQIERVDKQRLR